MIDKNLLWWGRGGNQACKAGRIQEGQIIGTNRFQSGWKCELIAFDANGNMLGKRKSIKGAKALVERNYKNYQGDENYEFNELG